MHQLFISLLSFLFKIIHLIFQSKEDLLFENILLRQQLKAYHAKKKQQKNITDITRLYLVALMNYWENWKTALVIVKPETVIAWQQKRFKKHWYKISTRNKKPGKNKKTKEIKKLGRRMAEENINWGAPRIYSEILMLGYSKKDIS